MKLQYSIFLLVFMTFINTNFLMAFENQNHTDSTKNKFKEYANISTGLIINRTFGVHPIINFSIGLRHKKNQLGIAYEYRFGNSKNYYQIFEDGTLKETNVYKASYVGLEYERVLIINPNHKFYTHTGIGADFILIKKNETITENEMISGMALNIGFGYTYYINKKHGPNIVLLYHFADIKNEKGTKLDKNYFLIRLSYFFGKDTD